MGTSIFRLPACHKSLRVLVCDVREGGGGVAALVCAAEGSLEGGREAVQRS